MQRVIAVEQKLRTTFDNGVVITRDKWLRPHPTADSVTRLEHNNFVTELYEAICTGQTSKAGTYDYCAHLGMLRRMLGAAGAHRMVA